MFFLTCLMVVTSVNIYPLICIALLSTSFAYPYVEYVADSIDVTLVGSFISGKHLLCWIYLLLLLVVPVS